MKRNTSHLGENFPKALIGLLPAGRLLRSLDKISPLQDHRHSRGKQTSQKNLLHFFVCLFHSSNHKLGGEKMLRKFRFHFESVCQRLQNSQRTTLVIVFLGLMLDNLLLTVVVPILPDYLYKIEHTDTVSDPALRVAFENVSVSEMEYDSNEEHEEVTTRQTFVAADLLNENSRIGLLFSSKAFVQLFVNPCVGIISGRYGYSIPSFFGLSVIFLSSVVFALGKSYSTLFFARIIQGFGSSALVISGMGLISSRYPEEVERSKNMGVALSGIAAGVLIGYPFGSIIYDAAGKTLPFVLIAVGIVFLGGIQLMGLPPQASHTIVQYSTSSKTLLKDPYILAVVVTICISTSAMAILEPCLPLWLLETMQPEPWQLGTAFVPDSIGYFIGSSFFGVFALNVGRWKCSLIAMVIVGISAICIPFASEIWHLILPHFGLGIGIGIVDASFMPLLAHLVDLRHDAVYGSVFAICQIAVCLAYFLGPLLGGLIANWAGFPFLMRGIGLVNILVSPVCLYLRTIPPRDQEDQFLINHQVLRAAKANSYHPVDGGGGFYHTVQSETDHKNPSDSAKVDSLIKSHGTEKNQIDRHGEY